MNLQKIADLLKSDANVDARTVVINFELNQVQFYTIGDPDNDADQRPSNTTEAAIDAENAWIFMNDCEGFYNEGVVWAK